MDTKIKLCGMFRQEDIDYTNELLPDYVGFVLNVLKSHRSIDRETAIQLKQRLSKKIKAVGVFVDEKAEICADYANSGIIDLIQLHGEEDAEYIRKLRKLVSVPIIKAVKVKSAKDIERVKNSGADYILLDGGTGSGKRFDYDLLEKAEISQQFFLAGGLDTENVKEAIEKFHPFAVDVSSALETNGMKDKNKMTAFMRAVRKELL